MKRSDWTSGVIKPKTIIDRIPFGLSLVKVNNETKRFIREILLPNVVVSERSACLFSTAKDIAFLNYGKHVPCEHCSHPHYRIDGFFLNEGILHPEQTKAYYSDLNFMYLLDDISWEMMGIGELMDNLNQVSGNRPLESKLVVFYSDPKYLQHHVIRNYIKVTRFESHEDI